MKKLTLILLLLISSLGISQTISGYLTTGDSIKTFTLANESRWVLITIKDSATSTGTDTVFVEIWNKLNEWTSVGVLNLKTLSNVVSCIGKDNNGIAYLWEYPVSSLRIRRSNTLNLAEKTYYSITSIR